MSIDTQSSVARRRALVVSVVCAVFLTGFFHLFGSAEREEPQNVSYSIAAGTSTDGWFDGPRVDGTFSRFGIPLYDGLQGTGSRLPYKAGWSNSIEWPLRLILNWEAYVLARMFLSTWAFLFLSISTIQSWRPRLSTRALVLYAILLLTPSPRFIRFEDWTDEWSITAATAGLGMFFLQRPFFEQTTNNKLTLFASPQSILFVPICLSHLVSGHAGLWPSSLFVLIPLSLSAVFVSPQLRLCINGTFRDGRVRLFLLIIPPVLTLTTRIWDLQDEAVGQEDWTEQRKAMNRAVSSLFPDQAFIGVTRGILPEAVERLGSVLFSNALAPLVRLVFPVSPPLDFVTRTAPSVIYGGFTAIGAVVVSLFVLRQLPARSPTVKFMVVVICTQLTAFALVWSAENAVLPLLLTPSGASKTFSVLLPLNILLTIVLLDSYHAFARVTTGFLSLNLVLVAMAMLIQIGVVSDSSTLRMPTRFSELVTTEESGFLPSSHRSAILTFDGGGEETSLRSGQSSGFPITGKPLFQSWAQVRNTNNMVTHVPTKGGFGYLRVSDRSVSNLVGLLEFFQIHTVLVPASQEARAYLTELRALQAGQGDFSIDAIQVRGFKLLKVNGITRFSSFVLSGKLSDDTVCPVLEKACPVMLEPDQLLPSSEPKLSVCDDPCIWTYETAPVSQGQTVIVPVSYDSTLLVKDSGGRTLNTTNVAGFLGVVGPLTGNENPLKISVSPDIRMNMLVLASYATVWCFIMLIGVAIRGRKTSYPHC